MKRTQRKSIPRSSTAKPAVSKAPPTTTPIAAKISANADAAEALLGRVRVSVLRVLIDNESAEASPLHLREIARRAGVAPAAAQRELKLLASLLLSTITPRGSQVFHAPNPDSLLLQALKPVLRLAPTLVDRLKLALQSLPHPALLAVLHGDTPADNPSAKNSSIDQALSLLVVTRSSFEDVLNLIEPVAQQLNPPRPVQLLVFTEQGYKQRLAQGDSTLKKAQNSIYATIVNHLE